MASSDKQATMAISKCNISLLCVWNLFADIWFINAVMVGIKSVKLMIYRRVWSFVRIQHYHWINGQVYTFVTKSQRVDFVICWRSIFILSQTFYNNLEKSFQPKTKISVSLLTQDYIPFVPYRVMLETNIYQILSALHFSKLNHWKTQQSNQ